jgi:hypothetical protein
MMQQQSKVAQFGMHQPKLPPPLSSSGAAASKTLITCELCDRSSDSRDSYLKHLQVTHQQMTGKTLNDMVQGAPLACSRCRDRFWTYEGFEEIFPFE